MTSRVVSELGLGVIRLSRPHPVCASGSIIIPFIIPFTIPFNTTLRDIIFSLNKRISKWLV